MVFDIEMIRLVYAGLRNRVETARKIFNRPLTLAEKILFSHLYQPEDIRCFNRGTDYVDFKPDRVTMQDATAQMALLQFMQSGKQKTEVPATVHCDHLIQAKAGAMEDLETATITNREIYEFLSSVSKKYGIGFWKPGAGIIHQVMLENYAFPGGMMIGTDSHTVNAGGLGMIAIGVGGADAVDAMVGMPWELKNPKLIGIRLTGNLHGWTSAKDVILKVAGMLTVKGGTGYILEYFGDGAQSLSCTGKATICNMGAEVGATTSLFGYDQKMSAFLEATGRHEVAALANTITDCLTGDKEVYQSPEKYFDQVMEIDLNRLEPHINGPFTPDKAWPVSQFASAVRDNGYPEKLEVGLIGSCTNSSYEDISRAGSIIKQALAAGLRLKSDFYITPGSEQVRYTMERDGLMDLFRAAGATILANACGPCIGQWARRDVDKLQENSIIHSFNRNFAKRVDGNAKTHAFVASPEMVTALSIAGSLTFNPLTDDLVNDKNEKIKLICPEGFELPPSGFEYRDNGYQPPLPDGSAVEIIIRHDSERLQMLKPFEPWNGKDMKNLGLLIKVKGKCTTDHISMAGPWLKYRGHLDNISRNLLIGAVNAFNDKTNCVFNSIVKSYLPVADSAIEYKKNGVYTIIVGDENYGEGSSREHAAMEPRNLGVCAIIVRSFARIHETNLKKQGILAFTFHDKYDYDKICEHDTFDITGLASLTPGAPVTLVVHHEDGSTDTVLLNHSFSPKQIEWFKAGSALNLIKKSLNSK